MEDELHIYIPIAGLAKDNHHRTNELLFGFPQKTIGIETDSPLFKFLTRIQDEVHRYAITFHRDKRSKNQVKSELDCSLDEVHMLEIEHRILEYIKIGEKSVITVLPEYMTAKNKLFLSV